jgi:hypothetical protein
MRGEFLPVWPQTWHYIWRKLARHENAPPDLFSELYRELTVALKRIFDAQQLADVVDDPKSSQQALLLTNPDEIKGEHALVEFLEKVYDICEDLGGDALSNRYFVLLDHFIDCFSLRYDLRRPCLICPTLSGVFAKLMRSVQTVAKADAHLDALLKDFEGAIRDLHSERTDGRIKTCIQKQINLLEAMARLTPGVTQNTLGAIANEITVWPHNKVRDAVKALYGFASDYPGIRHAGTPANAIRNIDMRDMVALTILLAGFSPYLSHQLDSDLVYHDN